jgi:hypothetical protein
MNEQNTKRIVDACPSLFETVNGELNFYFECGDGWADLLVELCQKIQSRLNILDKDFAKDIVALQVKEKYGTLRFYLSYYDELIELCVEDAEKKSAHTCEQCGKPGTLRGQVWLYTACDEHTREADLNKKALSELP